MQAVDDRIVLTRKQRVHGRQPDPPIAVDSSELLVRIIISGLWIEGQMTALVQMQLAVREKSAITAAHTVLHSEIGAVHLRCIPPMGGRVAVGSPAGPRPPGPADCPDTFAGSSFRVSANRRRPGRGNKAAD
jgi:hypothetical protein